MRIRLNIRAATSRVAAAGLSLVWCFGPPELLGLEGLHTPQQASSAKRRNTRSILSPNWGTRSPRYPCRPEARIRLDSSSASSSCEIIFCSCVGLQA